MSPGDSIAQRQRYVDLLRASWLYACSPISSGVTKTHKLTYGVGEAKSLNDQPTNINQLSIGAKELQNFLDKLAAKAGGDVTIWCGPKFFMMRSRDDSMDKSECLFVLFAMRLAHALVPPDHIRHCLATTVKLDIKAFQEWNITCEASVSFPLKEFKVSTDGTCSCFSAC